MSSTTETYEKITASLLSLIEKGDLLPWQKSWKGTDEFARSMATGKLYRGMNRWVLTLTAQANGWSPWFGTYKQIEALGGQVRKGEKSSLAILWKPMETIDKATGLPKKFMFLKMFAIFSASQADNLPEKFYAKPDPADVTAEVNETAQHVFDAYVSAQGIPVGYGGNRAFYSPAQDRIQLPLREAFAGTEEFYGTAFHEAAHSTGHKSRLNRDELNDMKAFGDHAYSREELVAELTSSLVLGTLGLDKPAVTENQAAYLKGWMSKIASDPQAFVWAAGKAEHAADMVLGITTTKEEVAA